MTRAQIEVRLRLPIMNLCLAVLSKQEGDLATTKAMLLNAVEKIVRDAVAEK